jgi:hypothetical protein
MDNRLTFHLCRLAAVVIALPLSLAAGLAGHGISDSRGLTISINGARGDQQVAAFFAMPGDSVTMELGGDAAAGTVRAKATGGELIAVGERLWTWTAPDTAGHWMVEFEEEVGYSRAVASVFVMLPRSAKAGGVLNGYRIGAYPQKPLGGDSMYLPPRGFVEVTEENFDAPVSSHFRIGQFVCKQAGEFPKYLVLDPLLLQKLERIGELLAPLGYGAPDIVIMSGYRTPAYNKAIGNVPYSLHLWGRAADIFVDRDGDGVMDDLDRNGRVDERDALFLRDLIARAEKHPYLLTLTGGLAAYRATPVRGPFVHVDVRGRPARWGLSP